jgi:Protein of unknown function (DUF3800)
VVIAYVDESGDDGERGSKSYVLGCVMGDSSQWSTVFDQLIAYRRHLRAGFKIPVRAELKANYLLKNGGPLRKQPLSEVARFKVYRSHMRLQAKLGLRAFAVVVDKEEAFEKFGGRRLVSDIAWEYLLQRLERSFRSTQVLLVHDEGDAKAVRARCRKARRAGTAGSAFGTGQLRAPFRSLLDDAISRDSTQSYFLQLADMSAYAAFRRLYPPPVRRVQIVPQGMWEELGGARFSVVRNTALYGGPEAIVPGP